MTKAEMEAMLTAIGTKLGLVTVEPKAEPKPAAKPVADDLREKRLAALAKAREAKKAKAKAKGDAAPAKVAPKASVSPKSAEVKYDANIVNNSKRQVAVTGNGETLTLHFCEGKSKYLVIVGNGERLYVRSAATIKAFAWVLRDGAGCKAVMDAAASWIA